MKTVFMGTPELAANILRALLDAGYEVGYAVTKADRARDRGKKMQATPVKRLAEEQGIKVLQPEKIKGNAEFLDTMREYGPDIIIVAAYGKLLPPEIINMPRLGCINVHASLLPKYRGAAPIERAILNGEKLSGVTLMKMDEGLDTGDMIAKSELEIDKLTGGELREALSDIGARLLLDTLPHIEEALKNAQPQDDSASSYAAMIYKDDSLLDFERSAKELECLLRAFDPTPGAACFFRGERVKLFGGEAYEAEAKGRPGELISLAGGKLCIACGEGALAVSEIQPSGKRRMAVSDYLRGHAPELGELFSGRQE